MTFVSPKLLCRQLGLTPKKSLGQHFLLHPEPARRIVAALHLTGAETVVEIGAGLGALTGFLAPAAHRVLALELHPATAAALAAHLADDFPQVEVLVQDALRFDFLALSRSLGQKIVVVGNLPYQITSPLLFRLLEAGEALAVLVFMMQKEVADRLLAPPGGKDYGLLSVLVHYRFRLEKLFTLSPGNFFPAPRVDSLVLKLTPEPPALPARDFAHLTQLVKLAFATRRKTLKNTLVNRAAEVGAVPSQVLTALQELDIDPSRRAETLAVSDFVRLSNALGPGGGPS